MPNSDQDQSSFEKTLVGGGHADAGHLELGTVVGGSYTLTSIIGRGGMGVVYAAQHHSFKRPYALKALVADQVNEANWKRFTIEGKVISKLEHRNIVKIYDMGIENEACPCYVMDLLDGPSLAEFIRLHGVLSVDQAVEIFSQICAGLGYAHKADIMPQGYKPGKGRH